MAKTEVRQYYGRCDGDEAEDAQVDAGLKMGDSRLGQVGAWAREQSVRVSIVREEGGCWVRDCLRM